MAMENAYGLTDKHVPSYKPKIYELVSEFYMQVGQNNLNFAGLLASKILKIVVGNVQNGLQVSDAWLKELNNYDPKSPYGARFFAFILASLSVPGYYYKSGSGLAWIIDSTTVDQVSPLDSEKAASNWLSRSVNSTNYTSPYDVAKMASLPYGTNLTYSRGKKPTDVVTGGPNLPAAPRYSSKTPLDILVPANLCPEKYAEALFSDIPIYTPPPSHKPTIVDVPIWHNPNPDHKPNSNPDPEPDPQVNVMKFEQSWDNALLFIPTMRQTLSVYLNFPTTD